MFKSVLWTAAVATLAAIAIVAPSRAADAPQFTAAVTVEPDSLDLTMSRNSGESTLLPPIRLETGWDSDEPGHVRHTVADWTISPDRKVITFKIHPGVKFQSGDELTAADWKFSWEREAKNSPFFKRHSKYIDKIEVLDKYTVRFTFNAVDINFFEAEAGGALLVSKAYNERVGDKEATLHPVGIGPYEIAGYKPGEYLDLKAFDGYYGKKPQVKSARLYFVKDDNTRVAKLEVGEVDLIMDTPYTSVASLKSRGFHTVELEAHPTMVMQFYMVQNAPWNKLKVREAIAHAIDGDAIAKGLFLGFPKHYPRLAPGEFGYDPSLKNYTFDPALSKKLLAQAGYPNGFDMPLFYWMAGYGFQQTAGAVALYLQKIGIRVHVEGLDPGKWLEFTRSNRNNPDAKFVGIGPVPTANIGSNALEALTIGYYNSPGSTYTNPEFLATVKEALSTLDDKKREELTRKAWDMTYRDVATLSIWNSVLIYSMKKNVNYHAMPHRPAWLHLKDVTMEGSAG
jgi:peptide/nickel transport system substrate-binding protein